MALKLFVDVYNNNSNFLMAITTDTVKKRNFTIEHFGLSHAFFLPIWQKQFWKVLKRVANTKINKNPLLRVLRSPES